MAVRLYVVFGLWYGCAIRSSAVIGSRPTKRLDNLWMLGCGYQSAVRSQLTFWGWGRHQAVRFLWCSDLRRLIGCGSAKRLDDLWVQTVRLSGACKLLIWRIWRLLTSGRRWFNQLDEYNLFWDERKAKLREALPRRRNFATWQPVARVDGGTQTPYWVTDFLLPCEAGVVK